MQEKKDNVIDLGIYRRPYAGNAASPFRYPGGKGFLSPFLAAEIGKRFPGKAPEYAEPYCGGAGAALNLLVSGDVNHLHLNDADCRIYSAWRAIVTETDRFLDRISKVDVNLETWDASLRILYDVKNREYDFEVGFATFFVNRTSRSGVIIGSGPIGGYSQEGQWKIDVRFNKASLAKKISAIGALRERITLYCQDGLEFCCGLATKGILDSVFLFVDPPYVGAGGRLYYNGMTEKKHQELAGWLRSGEAKHWLLTYDDHPLVRSNFDEVGESIIQVNYSLAKKRSERELLYMSSF